MTPPPALAVIVPTFNERPNVRELARRVGETLSGAGISYEIVFVDDDSPDGTWEEVLALSGDDDQVRLVHRIGRRGLSSAAFEGILASRGDFVAVMDADLQHDERILPQMLDRARQGADVVVGSRYAGGGGVGAWDDRRRAMSRWATRAARRVIPQDVSDPLSGYFLCKRGVARAAARRVSARGFKILAEILSSDPTLTAAEVPYEFRPRHAGESKMTASVVLEYAEFLYDRTVGRAIPLRFAKYCVVGAAGALVHLAVLYAGMRVLALTRGAALAAAIEAAIVFNFALNNRWTFSDYVVRGPRTLPVFLRYNLVCSIGALSAYSVGVVLAGRGLGTAPAYAAGAIVGAIWNYSMAKMFTWKASG